MRNGYLRLSVLCLLIVCLTQITCARRSPNIYPLDAAYYRPQSLVNEMQRLADSNPGTVEMQRMGYTGAEKMPLYLLKIQTDINRIPILIIGQHHGDEIMGVQIAMEMAKRLSSLTPDTNTQSLLDTYAFWIIPTLNPEGWNVVTSGKYEWKRKNNTLPYGRKKLRLKLDGVDLNRNYPTFWQYDPPVPPEHPYYKGTAPASEREIQAIMQLGSLTAFRYVLSYHTSVTGNFGETIYLPWQDRKDVNRTPDFLNMRDFANVYAQYCPRDYVPGNYRVHAGATSRIGNARNHFYYQYGSYAYDIETCGINANGVSVVHPVALQMRKVVEKNVYALYQALIYASQQQMKEDSPLLPEE